MVHFKPAHDALFISSSRPDGSKAVFSRLHAFQRVDTDSPTVSIKYVMQGLENYRVNRHTHRVKDGEFLVVNQTQSLEIDFASQQAVLGLCLYVNEQIVNDVYRNMTGDDGRLLDNPVSPSCRGFDFYESVCSVHDDTLGQFLEHLACRTNLQTGQITMDSDELYYQTAEGLLRSQLRIAGAINRMSAQQVSTRTELFRRVNLAKRMIDADVQANWTVAELASQAALSEFHFFRSFKQAFGVSPRQYLIQKRLQQSASLLKTRQYAIADVAFLTGFSDVFAFSKAFKKAYLTTPAAYRTE
ncbi:AraC family transcriptional regulator [Spirosoma fluminis]